MENIKLTEGEYEIAEGCEYVGQECGKLIVKKKPDIKQYDIVISGDGRHMGVFKQFNTIKGAAYYIDFCYDINYKKEVDVVYFYRNRGNVVAENLRKANDEAFRSFGRKAFLSAFCSNILRKRLFPFGDKL